MNNDDYVLRPLDRQEIVRLELQHQVWRDETEKVLKMANFKAGDSLLDLGAGPGFLTWDLATLVGPEGSVLALDNSKEFVQHLLLEAKARRMPWVRAEIADVRTYDLEPASLDGVICRWVLMFIAEAEQAIVHVTRALRPGGMIAVMEYTQFRSMSLWPGGMSFKRIYEAVHELIARNGGDADIGGRVPELLARVGCEIIELIPVWRVGRPGSAFWQWLDATGKNHPNLVEAGLVTAVELESYYREWDEHAVIPGAFFTAPPILATIARKL